MTNQGQLVGQMRKKTTEDIRAQAKSRAVLAEGKRLPVCAIADNIRSLHNVGAIFRTADGFRLEKIYLCGITGTPPHDRIRKSSLGAEESVPWEYHQNTSALVKRLRTQGYQIVALEQTDSSVPLLEVVFRFPLALVVGHEFNGIAESVLSEVQQAVEIPMLGAKTSFNVSIAFGIAVYEIFRQYHLERNKI